jgi:predicted O-methyltransferase YrrM
LDELKKGQLEQELKSALELRGALPVAGMTTKSRGPVLYSICRALKPAVVVETGVSSGVSSSFILEAMQMNGLGKLCSIDYPDQESPETTGWLIPDRLRSRWTLTIGKSSAMLESILRGKGEVDLFLHDIDHSYENMMFEFHCAWHYIRKGGLLLSDDTDMNDSFANFASEVGCKGVRFYALSGIRK